MPLKLVYVKNVELEIFWGAHFLKKAHIYAVVNLIWIPSPWNHQEWGVLMFVENSRYIWTSVHLCQWNSAVWDCPKQWALYHQKVFRFCDRKEGTVKTIRINRSAPKTESYHSVSPSKAALLKTAVRENHPLSSHGSLRSTGPCLTDLSRPDNSK